MRPDSAITRSAAAEVGIILAVVASALLGLYAFVPDGGLRMFNSLPSIWQPIMKNTPVFSQPQFFEREMIDAGPFRPWPFWYVNDEEIMESLQLLSEILGPIIGPRIPPEIEPPIPPLPLLFLQAAIDAIFGVWTYIMTFLAMLVLAKNISDYDEKRKFSKDLEQTNKGYLDTTKTMEEQAEKIVILHNELKEVTMEMTKTNDEKDKKIVELSDELEQLETENLRVTQNYSELGSLLGLKTKEYVHIKKAHDDLSDSLEQGNQKLLDMTQAHDQKTQKLAVLDDQFSRKTKELQEAQNINSSLRVRLEQIEAENKKLTEDTQDLQERFEEESRQVKRLLEEKTSLLRQFDEKSRQMKQLEEDQKNEQKEREEASKQVEQKLKEDKTRQLELLEEMSKEVKQSKDDAKEQKEKAEDRIDALKGQLKGCEERNTSLGGEHSKSKSARGGLEDERNSLLEEAKKRDADLKQLQTRCERIEKERDRALDEVHAQKEAWEKHRLVEEAKNGEEEKAMVDGASSMTATEEGGTGKPHLITAGGGDEASEDDEAEGNEDNNTKMAKISGRKKRRRRRKQKDSAQSSPTKTEPDSPLNQFVRAGGAVAEAEKDSAPVEETLPSGASTKDSIDEGKVGGGGEDDAAAASDPDEGPSELPDNIGSPTKHRRPGRRNSKQDHKFEAEKRKRKEEEKMAERRGSTEGGDPGGPGGWDGNEENKREEGNGMMKGGEDERRGAK